MSIPINIDTQIPLSRFGEEKSPFTIILKGTMWVLFLKNSTIYIREFQGSRIGIDIITPNVDFFTISYALDNSGQISTDKLWVWYIRERLLYFIEVEPFQDKIPTISNIIPIITDIGPADSASFKVDSGNIIKSLIIGYETNGLQAIYHNFPSGGLQSDSANSVLSWTQSRLIDCSILIEQSNSPEKFLTVYLDTSSPPNVNLEEIEEHIPFEWIISLDGVSGSSHITSHITIIKNFIIQINPSSGFIDDEIIITTGNGLFENGNFVYFGSIMADQVTFIDIYTLKVIVPNGAVSCNIHVETSISISNYVPFDIPYPDEHFPDKTRIRSKFDSGIGKSPIYNRDIGITNFTEIVDENSIIQNVYNILLTRPGERLFNPNFGCSIHNKVFDLIDSIDVTEKEVLNIIDDSLRSFEPRVLLLKDQSFVDFTEDDNALTVVLAVRIPGGIIKEVAISIGKGIKSF